MRIRVTASARTELLETVARLRERHRDEAARFVLAVEDRLQAVADGTEAAPEMEPVWRAADHVGGHRLYLRERGDVLWLLAVWPEGHDRIRNAECGIRKLSAARFTDTE